MQLERYRLESEIGRGAMATVYRAYDTKADRPVALKLLHRRFLSDEAIRARFIQEAKTVAQMRHRAIVPILHAAQVGEDIFLVMPLMPGGSLADRLRRGPLPIAETLDVLERIAAALDYAHTRDVIHRDVKPDNILFDESGQAYLADFGVIKLVESTLTLTGTGLIGTPAYMSPEQVRGAKQLDSRSDIYGLGVVLFEMLAGRVPYDGESEMDVAMKHISAPIPNIRSFMGALSSGWQKVINRAMAKKPEERFQTGAELMTAVRQLAANQPAAVDRRLPLALAAVALLLLVGAGMYFAGRAVAGRGTTETETQATTTAEVTSVAAVEPTQLPPTGQIGVFFSGSSSAPFTLNDSILVVDELLELQVDISGGQLLGSSIYAAPNSQIEFAAVDAIGRRISYRLSPGSNIFVESGGYTNEVVTLGAFHGIMQAGPGSCMSLTYPQPDDDEPIILSCHHGACGYRIGSGARAELAAGRQIVIDPGDISGNEMDIPDSRVAAMLAIISPTSDGRRDANTCGLTSLTTPTATRIGATPTSTASTSTWTPTPTAMPTDTPTATTTRPLPEATLTLIPPAAPVITAPPHGVYQNPLNFSWSSQSGITYQVTLRHTDLGITHQSDWLSRGNWSINIPSEQFGNWEWYVVDNFGQKSTNGTFVFDPHVEGTVGLYDLNGDCRIDDLDLSIIANWNYGCSAGDICYSDRVDFNNNGIIDDEDVAQIGSRMGRTVPNCTP